MPLRDRKRTAKPNTAESLALLEQQVTTLRDQLFERFELLQVTPQQEVDRKTAREAAGFEREYELIVLPFRGWDPGAIINAKALADEGDLERAADLWESALADDRVASAMEQRINGLEGLPVRFTGDGEDVLEAVSTDFWQMMQPGDRAAMRRWGLGLGICPVYVTEWVENAEGRQIPICEVWNPRFLRWRQEDGVGKRSWWIQTATNQIKLSDQPGRWFLFTPFSGANQRPWVDGIWYSVATWWLAKSFGIADLASFSQSHATPKWFLMPKEGAQIDKAEKQDAIRRLAALPQRSGMYVPAGFTVEQKETTSTAWNAITALIELANKALTVRIIGTDSTTDKESSYASTAGGMQLLYAKFRTDADAESAFWHDGPLQFWYLLNWRGTRKLEDRRVLDLEADPRTGVYRLLDESERYKPTQRLRQLSEQIRAGDEVPWPTRDATPPEDMAAVAETQGKAAGALVQLTTAAAADPNVGAAIARIDFPRYLERYFPMFEQDESGVQLEMEDGTILELKAKSPAGGHWVTVEGRHILIPGNAKGKLKIGKDGEITVGGKAVTGGGTTGERERPAGKVEISSSVKRNGRTLTGKDAEAHRNDTVKDVLGKHADDDAVLKTLGIDFAGGKAQVNVLDDTVEVKIEHPDFYMHRTFMRGEDGKRVCYNDEFVLKGEKGTGRGTQILKDQMEGLRQNGFDRMETSATRDIVEKGVKKSYNGYYTWPRLGYDAKIPSRLRDELPDTLDYDKHKNVSDLMKSKEGRDWWKANGQTIQMSFDLKRNSANSQIFESYLKEKGK